MAFPLIAALIGAGSSLAGSAISARASRRASEAQGETAQQNRDLAETSTRESLSDFDSALQEAIAVIDPYRSAGTGALNQYTNALGLNGPEGNQSAVEGFQRSPGYQFAVDEGVNAIDRSANARGRLYSGATMRDTLNFGQGMANQEWDNYLNRIAGVAGAGQSAAGAIADTTLGTAANRANVRLGGLNAITGANSDIGAAEAAGEINRANSWNNGLTNLTQMIGYGGGQGFSMPLLERWRNGGGAPVVSPGS